MTPNRLENGIKTWKQLGATVRVISIGKWKPIGNKTWKASHRVELEIDSKPKPSGNISS
jgi:hypothetical protein